MRIKKRPNSAVKFNQNKITNAIINAMKQTAEEIKVKKSGLYHLVYQVIGVQIEKSLETSRDEIESQINGLRDRLRKLRAFYNKIIYGKDSNFSRFLNFLKRIWSRTKKILGVILFIEGIYDTIVRVINAIFPKNASLSKEYDY